MHSFLKTVGFSELKQRKLNEILENIVKDHDEKYVSFMEDERIFIEYIKYFGDFIGISVCGYCDEDKEFRMEYYYPFFKGEGVTSKEKIYIEKNVDKESFAGACDDLRVNITLIFYLQKPGKYMKEQNKLELDAELPITLSGLASNGKILFPIKKDKDLIKIQKESISNRNDLVAAARNGDEDAIESLTMEEMYINSSITHRMETEDIMTIVESYIMPYGIECDRYGVMGEIMKVDTIVNNFTGEELYKMTIEAHDVVFDVVINKNELLGEPMAGRRFKGTIWLQGNLHYNS